jgi:putative transposase
LRDRRLGAREWGLRFGRMFANSLKRQRPRPGDKWHLDEVFIRIRGKLHYLWRAVDQDGQVLDILVQNRRNAKAARRFFRKLLKDLQYVPRVMVTDKLRSYGAAKRDIMPSVEHRQSRYLNNRAEASHQPTRRQERHMKRFKSARHAQHFLSAHCRIHNHFQLCRHLLSAGDYRAARTDAFRVWLDVVGIMPTPNLPETPQDRTNCIIKLTVPSRHPTSEMGRFETEWLTSEANLTALSDLSGAWIDRVHARKPPTVIVLDIDSRVSETHGAQEGSAYNGHFGCTCYHPLFVFNQFGDLERWALRPGVHSADG